ncbi:uncharacterized protein LOC129224085 isoform X2 [Uloborus diversus]|uniref:uncharacterized protein LOC129224085 isoform X2 n=1 Tax=Uloborus diversus TaxID=327109 RepID=UPI002409D13A|nr:uncharacterized protein LOC129224085 isoform X2 [Uloborus diversus]
MFPTEARPPKMKKENTMWKCEVIVFALCICLLFGQNVTGTVQHLNLTSSLNQISEDELVLENFSRTERSFHSDSMLEPPQRPSADQLDPKHMPYFDNSTERNVTYQDSKPVYLHCKVRNIGDRSVSWVRQRDLHILTVGDYTYTTDQRFTSMHFQETDVWTLEIKYPRQTDAGVYECQVNTEPKMSLGIRLNILVAEAKIIEGPNLYVQDGSHLNLTCVATPYVNPPPYVFWHHDGETISYDSHHRGITVTTDRINSTTISRLHIHSVRAADSGNYSCQPSFAEPANTTVHVLNGAFLLTGHRETINDEGEKPAAMQHGRQNSAPVLLSSSLLVNSMFILLSFFLYK